MTSIDFRLNKQLWMFLVLAEEEHFGRAAERLGMTQPPLSEHIRTLEASLGVVLFDRSRRGTRLTAAGAALLPAVQRFADHARDLERTIGEILAGQSGVLNVGSITSAMTDVVPRWLRLLRQQAPSLSVSVQEIDSVEAVPGLLSGDLDLAFFRLNGAPGPGLDSFPVTYDQLCLAMPNDHQMARETEISLLAVAGEPMIMSSRRVSPIYFDSIVEACRTHGVNLRILHEVRSIASQVAYVSCGQGLALVPQSMVSLAPDNVIFVPIMEKVSVVTTAVAWPTGVHAPVTSLAVNLLRDTVKVLRVGAEASAD